MKAELSPEEIMGRPVVDQDGQDVGVVTRVYYDNRTREPKWLEVRGSGWLGRLGVSRGIVPTDDAALHEEPLRVAYPVDQVRHAPRMMPGEYLSAAQEARLCYHYGCPDYGHGAWSPHTGSGWPVHRWFLGGPRYGWMAGQQRLDDERRTGGVEEKYQNRGR